MIRPTIDFLKSSTAFCLVRTQQQRWTDDARERRHFKMDMNVSTIDGACDCGTVRFRVRLTNGLHTARRCTCSYCRKRGAVAVLADLGGIDILSGGEALSLYKFNTRTAKRQHTCWRLQPHRD